MRPITGTGNARNAALRRRKAAPTFRLEPGGVLAMNVYAIGDDSPNLRAIQNTLATVFGTCVRISQYWGTNYMLMAFNAAEPLDLTRLAPARIALRWGAREDVGEWDDLVTLASRIPRQSRLVTPDATGKEWVLTDDHGPLEWLTDRFVLRLEDEVMGR